MDHIDDYEIYLKKRAIAFRKSCDYYSKWCMGFGVAKIITGSSVFSVFSPIPPLAAISALTVLIEGVEKVTKIQERKTEYSVAYKQYEILHKKLLSLIDTNLLSQDRLMDIFSEEKKIINSLTFSPREIYIKKLDLNGVNK